MIPVIECPEEGGVYCAGRQYRFYAQGCEDAISIVWHPIDMPPGVEWDDIQQTSPNGIENYMTFPVAGEYCFDVRCAVMGEIPIDPEALELLLGELGFEPVDPNDPDGGGGPPDGGGVDP